MNKICKVTMNFVQTIESIYYTIILYLKIFVELMTPGTIIWKLFGNRKGKVCLLNRDLICDSETLMNLPKCGKPLDGFTNAFCPFIPAFVLDNDHIWKQRREVFSFAQSIINKRILEKHVEIQLETKQGNILWEIYEIMFKVSFELVFNRSPTEEEFNDMYPGILDINQIIKRFTSKPNFEVRQKLYDRILKLIQLNEEDFVLFNHQTFQQMKEIDQVSLLAEDILITMSLQCTDLVCHMLLLYSQYPEQFINDIDNSINETLRLYPLTDLWTRESNGKQRGWIASLVQLNRNGWTQPDTFVPQRWNEKQHPPLMSWGFDIRRCPAQKLATNLSILLFENIIQTERFWIQPAANFIHERTFPYGCQVSIGYGNKPTNIHQWKFNNKFQMQFRRWICEKLRIINQNEFN
jgi:hypothetical protein